MDMKDLGSCQFHNAILASLLLRDISFPRHIPVVGSAHVNTAAATTTQCMQIFMCLWFEKLSKFLLENGFTRGKIDNTIVKAKHQMFV